MEFKRSLEKELKKVGEDLQHAGFVELTILNKKLDLIKELLKYY